MNHLMLMTTLAAALGLSACQREVVPVTVPVPVPVPGPPGATGATGSPGAPGDPGRPGASSTVIVVPPAASAPK